MEDFVSPIASFRTRASDGAVSLTAPPISAVGKLLGTALIADTVPNLGTARGRVGSTRTGFVTASLLLRWSTSLGAGTPHGARPRMVALKESYLTSESVIRDSEERVVATCSGMFARRPWNRIPARQVSGPPVCSSELDEIAEDLESDLRRGWRSSAESGFGQIDVRPPLRNRSGVLHGAAAYALLAMGAAIALDGRIVEDRQIVEGYVRFLWPLEPPMIDLTMMILRRSHRSSDVATHALVRGRVAASSHFYTVSRTGPGQTRK